MSAAPWEWTFDHISELEIPICRLCHRWSATPIQHFFGFVSKVGDGHYWYLVLGFLILHQGRAALPLFCHVVLAGIVCYVVYRSLKRRTARQRPFAFAEGFELEVNPLDKYSFPSGHTMHVVFFTFVVGAYVPALLWMLVPFSILVATSRIVLGLHFPTDVAAGGLLGSIIAYGSFFVV